MKAILKLLAAGHLALGLLAATVANGAPLAGEVVLTCGQLKENSLRVAAATRDLTQADINVEVASEALDSCEALLQRAAVFPVNVDLRGKGSRLNEIPNSDFRNWPGASRVEYGAPRFGERQTYSGTGGRKVEHARCWVSNVWGLYGGGVISRIEDKSEKFLNWVGDSTSPPPNQCGGERRRCSDDPDATGFHHVFDPEARRLVRAGTAGHDLSQLIPVRDYLMDWVSVRVRIRYNKGNEKFYVRLMQGVGKDGQMKRSDSRTLPGIELVKDGSIHDYLMFVNLRGERDKLRDLTDEARDLQKYVQISLSSARPEYGHDIDVFRISLHRGISAPQDPEFGSPDPRIAQRGEACGSASHRQ
ncbi:hypothetical protein CTP10_R45060 [Cupriavidus sp. P-10]|uniref:hypothetical protein n=1 Tax=Cupriavidus sp. P-10 TaxID=2027911 RepID=UPI0011C1CCC8|nr:hypothetical protein [Cupriavidus sp. P-10]BDB27101.1 hypothetical protein CTP10_R45060 [Cupriavidus sp. P-10]